MKLLICIMESQTWPLELLLETSEKKEEGIPNLDHPRGTYALSCFALYEDWSAFWTCWRSSVTLENGKFNIKGNYWTVELRFWEFNLDVCICNLLSHYFALQFMPIQAVYLKFFGSLMKPTLKLFLCFFRLWTGSSPCIQIPMGQAELYWYFWASFQNRHHIYYILMMNNIHLQISFHFEAGLRLK